MKNVIITSHFNYLFLVMEISQIDESNQLIEIPHKKHCSLTENNVLLGSWHRGDILVVEYHAFEAHRPIRSFHPHRIINHVSPALKAPHKNRICVELLSVNFQPLTLYACPSATQPTDKVVCPSSWLLIPPTLLMQTYKTT